MSPTSLVLLAVFVILAFVILRLRNKTLRWALLALLLLFLIHPFLLGVPGFLGEMGFEHGLHHGMSAEQVAQLRDSTGGEDHGPFLGRADTDSHVSPVYFMDWGTACANGGREYLVHFDEASHVDSWTVKRWYGGC